MGKRKAFGVAVVSGAVLVTAILIVGHLVWRGGRPMWSSRHPVTSAELLRGSGAAGDGAATAEIRRDLNGGVPTLVYSDPQTLGRASPTTTPSHPPPFVVVSRGRWFRGQMELAKDTAWRLGEPGRNNAVVATMLTVYRRSSGDKYNPVDEAEVTYVYFSGPLPPDARWAVTRPTTGDW